MIDTTKVPGRRTLRFDTIERMLADARACVAADAREPVGTSPSGPTGPASPHAGPPSPPGLTRLGNWTIGQALNHIAAWIEYPFIGYPTELVIPDELKAAARAAKERIMGEPMQPGERLPVEGPARHAGTLATEVVSARAGLARLEAAAALLHAGEPQPPHRPTPIPDPAFGPVTHHEWTQMTLRHAELHLSFFIP